MPEFHVHFLPSLTTADELAGSTVVVIDVLRATTTIAQALTAGATEIIPCTDVDQARRVAASLPGQRAVLGGERGGLRIDGFDLGNSPLEYTAASVGGAAVVFTTTNGTLAMQSCRKADEVLLAAFVNLEAVRRRLDGRDAVHVLCAGTRGRIAAEDVLAAGALVQRLGPAESPCDLNDQAQLAVEAWRSVQEPLSRNSLATQLSLGAGGRNVLKIGLQADIEFAARIDLLDVVPSLDVKQWRVRTR